MHPLYLLGTKQGATEHKFKLFCSCNNDDDYNNKKRNGKRSSHFTSIFIYILANLRAQFE
jgi:hypothetical protein